MRVSSLISSFLGLSAPDTFAPSNSLALITSNASSSHHTHNLRTRGLTWTSLGCVPDSTSARVLSGTSTASSSMSTESCQSYCFSSGYLYAGTESGSTCFCGNSVPSGLGSSSSCSTPCSGNSGETCGGNLALSLYQSGFGGSAGSTSQWVSLGCYVDASSRALTKMYADSLSMTMEWCQNYCLSAGYTFAGVEYAEECMCDNAIQTGSGQGVLATDGRCDMGCLGNTAEQCGGTWGINIWQYTTVTVSNGWTDMGCYVDASSRVLTSMYADSLSMTIEWCENYCLSSGYIYAGIEYAEECMCGNTINTGSGQGVLATDGRCNMGCLGNTAEQCGGTWGIQIYKYGSSSTSTTTTMTTATTTTTATTASASPSQTWVNLGCRVDVSARALSGYAMQSSSMTVEVCQNYCSGNGFQLAGLENGDECWCGNSFSNNGGGQAASTDCSTACAGNSAEICGGGWRLSVYTLSTAASVTSVASSTTTSSTTTSSTVTSSTTTSSTTSSTAAVQTTGLTTNKVVVAHHIVGNTYPYTQSNWASDIALAQASGIDAFALNYGSDSWEPGQLASAYAAASSTSFKLFLSADMSSLSGASTGDAQNLANQVALYRNHPSQLYLNGGMVLSTFSGESSYFGQGSVNSGWQSVLNMIGGSITFIPSFFVDPSQFGNYPVMNGAFNWNGGWPSGDQDITYTTDQQWLSGLNGKLYMAAISPNFFTHYSYKNFLYKNDDNLFATRWEMLIANRNQVAIAEIISWNDYGESHYVGPIEGAMPDGTTWVDGFPHTAWLDLNNYYAFAFKYGFYPPITQDKIYIYGRPNPVYASACCDSYGPPSGYTWEVDDFYIVVLATSPGSLILSTPPSGSGASPTSSNANPTTVNINAGVNKFSQGLVVGSGMRATLYRSGQQIVDVNPSDFTFSGSPQQYNFNVYVAMGSS
ncbi:glycoside hydrolase family 71 protein [Calocera viscosa TUFC12733]|uniref:Glycoside hydrolase family 71 protein n=1 Tax=Calocera viscosa (strain TUFC12733) TaxID=1330018 RepID=A0A167LYX0_CALVF|nr:glycoside hydrolase family 71 protein [Calocera viscosa TUFC12733]